MNRAALAVCVLALVALPAAFAGLGERVDSIERTRSATRGQSKAIKHDKFITYVVQSGEMTVKQFAADDGTIFAVSWQGPDRPDVPDLLGRYFGEYEASVSRPRFGRRAPSIAKTPGLDVVNAGRPGHFRGRAIALPLMPEGVRAEDLR